MSTAARGARAHRHVLQTCGTPSDSRTLRIEVVRQLQDAVGFEAYAWLATDPETSVGTSPVADVPWLRELPEQIRLKYQTPLHRWTQLTGPVARLFAATSGDLAASLVWREFLSHHGVTDAASVVFRDRFGCWGFLELWRTHGSPPFTEGEAAFLDGHRVQRRRAAARRRSGRRRQPGAWLCPRRPWSVDDGTCRAPRSGKGRGRTGTSR